MRSFGLDAQHARLQHESKAPFYLQGSGSLEIDSGALALNPLPCGDPVWVTGADKEHGGGVGTPAYRIEGCFHYAW